MADWKDQYRPASFRGVAFSVTTSEAGFGRRTQVHEYPLRDKPYVEDLGRKTRAMNVEAVVIGSDYMAKRDALINAVEQAGPGRLVHPYLGELTVTITDCKVRESTANGGMAVFALTCIESGEATFPTQVRSTGDAVATTGTAAQAASSTQLQTEFTVTGKPAFVAAAASGVLSGALQQMQSVAATVQGDLAAVATLAQAAQTVQSQIVSIVQTPAALAQALVGNLQTLIRTVATTPADALVLARSFFSFGDLFGTVPATTRNRQQQALNQQRMVDLVRVTAVSEAALAVTTLTFSSFQAATALRDELTDQVSDLMLTAGDDVYEQLRALRSAIVDDITTRGADLARLISFTPDATQPALVIAQRLYADATRDEDLIARNDVSHPLFVRAGQALEVLADE